MPRHPRGFCFPAHCVFPSAFFHPGPQWPVGQWFLQPSSPIVSVLGMWEVGSALWRCSPEPVFQSSYTHRVGLAAWFISTSRYRATGP